MSLGTGGTQAITGCTNSDLLALELQSPLNPFIDIMQVFQCCHSHCFLQNGGGNIHLKKSPQVRDADNSPVNEKIHGDRKFK